MIRPTVLETAAWGVGESVLHGKGLFAAREIPQGRPILAEARVLEHLAAAEGVNLTTAHNRFFDDLRNLNQADRSFVSSTGIQRDGGTPMETQISCLVLRIHLS